MSSPAAGWALNDYRTETNKGKRKTESPHVAGCLVERGLGDAEIHTREMGSDKYL